MVWRRDRNVFSSNVIVSIEPVFKPRVCGRCGMKISRKSKTGFCQACAKKVKSKP